MVDTKWHIRALQLNNCNCPYGCPCQFSGLPPSGSCRAILAFEIREGRHGAISLDNLRVAQIFRWPGAVHQGRGESATFIDKRATDAQRNALGRILSGKDTEPGATLFSIFSSTMEKVHETVFTDIDFEIDIERRRGRARVSGYLDSRIEPILNPVTKAETRVRIDNPNGFEFKLAEVARGWTTTQGPLQIEMADSYSHLCHLNLSQSGIID